MISLNEITKLAELARIKLSEKEKNELQNDMETILDYFKKIKELEINNKTELSDALNLTAKKEIFNELRNDDDIKKEKDNSEFLFQQMPETKNGYLKVKKIL